MKWIKLADRKPEVSIEGEKILMCRISNEGQLADTMTIGSTRLIHLSNPEETWWMALPELPQELVNFYSFNI